ncbi:hypothetical protein PUR34_02830 [Streptomyces sp. JV185]|uniref:LGFP repeat-containing protein n=1 Tax=Streptomyces sp. JV185 TaxID=858638 RepID=UPI002E79D648|nr:hypothetical protein [Streptomyces sp. JV185]MEE1767139.1 hypothetical protein [Streptomyces sp. JV185]
MHLSAAIRRGIRSRISTGLSALVMLTGLGVAVTPAMQAEADSAHCGHQVLGAIEKRYLDMGGPNGTLGCPLTDELTNPDGIGRRTQFEHGTIYWSPRSGAWPVWGAIGEYWCNDGCERSVMGYPTSYERKVGDEVQQNFQCAVIHWKQVPGNAEKAWREITCT